MAFLRRILGRKEGEKPVKEGQGPDYGKPVRIMGAEEDSLTTRIDKIHASGGISPGSFHRGLLIYALRVRSAGSFLSNFQAFLQEELRVAAHGGSTGTVLELTDPVGHRIPHGMLLRILGMVSLEGGKRGGKLILASQGEPGQDIVIAFILREHPALPDGEMQPDAPLAEILRDVARPGTRVPSASAHAKISRMCKPGNSLSQLPRLIGMVLDTLRGEGIPEPNVLDLTRVYLAGTCPACRRPFSGEEIVLLCGMKQSMKVQETTRIRNLEGIRQRKPGEEMDVNWRLNRLNRGLCLNPQCNSSILDLSWNQPSSP